MKKIISLIFICLFILSINITSIQASNIKIEINKVERTFTPAPIIQNNLTLIPLRSFFESLGAEVHWDNETQGVSARRGDCDIKFNIGSSWALVNGQRIKMEPSSQLIGWSTYVPLRFVAESLGDELVWENGIIRITSSQIENFNNEKSEHYAKLFPLAKIYQSSLNPGDFFTLSLEKVLDTDDIIIESKLINTPLQLNNYQNAKILFQPISYYTSPGEYPLKVSVHRNGVKMLDYLEIIQVKPKDFLTQQMQVSSSVAAMRSADLWALDAPYFDKAREKSHPTPLWEGNFLQPCQGRISTEFGVIRYVNREEVGRHSGLDIAANYHTPIKASNNGVVTLAMPLNVTGNTVIIDHGCNIFSIYYHMQDIYLSEGSEVKKGDIIGTVGSTGFSTGPHLHWTMSLGSTVVNPWLFTGKNPLDPLNQ